LLFPVGLVALAMKSFCFSLLTAALFVAGVSAQLTVNTPVNVVECTPLTITWTGGTGPYFLSLHSGNDVNGAPLISFPSTTDTSLTWPAVNFTSGTSLDLSLRDSAGASSQSAVFTVQAGGDSSCLNGGSSSAGSSAAGSSTSGSASASASTPATSPTTTPATTPAASGSTASTPRASGSTSSSASRASSTSSTSNAAMATGVSYGVAGVLGAAVAAVFV